MKRSVSPILLVAAAVLMGTVLDSVVRIAAEKHDLVGLLFWRWILASAVLGGLYFLPNLWKSPINRRRFIDRAGMKFYLIRGFLHASMVLSFFWGLTQLPLAEATTLGFSGVLLVGPMEALILREPLRRAALWAALVGFAGVLIIVGLSDQVARVNADPMLGRLACGSAAIFYALSLVLLRERAQKDDRFTLATYSALAGVLWFTPAYLWIGADLVKDGLLWAAAIAAVGTLVWFLMGSAYALAPAHVLAPLEYTSFLWAALFGYVLFGERPSPGLWLGAAIIVGAALMLFVDERRQSRG